MKKDYYSYLLLSFCTLSIHSMDNHQTNNPTELQNVAHVVINTTEDLAKHVLKKRGINLTDAELDKIHMSEELIAQLMGSLALGKDDPTPMHDQVVKSVRSLSTKDPAQLRRQKKVIINQAIKHDGDLSARNISERKKLINSSPKIVSEDKKDITSPKKDITSPKQVSKDPKRASMALNLESIKNFPYQEYDEEFAQAKQEMRELMLAAAEHKINSSDKEATRNLVLAGIGLITTIAGPIVTYFTSQAGDSCPTNNTNSTN